MTNTTKQPQNNDPFKKWAWGLNRHFSKKVNHWPASSVEDVHHLLLGNAGKSHMILSPDSLRMAAISFPKMSKMWRTGGALEHCRWECEMLLRLQKTIWRFFRTWKIHLPCASAPHLWVRPEEQHQGVGRMIFRPMCSAALLTVWKGSSPKMPGGEMWRSPAGWCSAFIKKGV